MAQISFIRRGLSAAVWTGLVTAGIAGLIWSGYPILAIVQLAVFRQPQGF